MEKNVLDKMINNLLRLLLQRNTEINTNYYINNFHFCNITSRHQVTFEDMRFVKSRDWIR